jgi:hypothetical protein
MRIPERREAGMMDSGSHRDQRAAIRILVRAYLTAPTPLPTPRTRLQFSVSEFGRKKSYNGDQCACIARIRNSIDIVSLHQAYALWQGAALLTYVCDSLDDLKTMNCGLSHAPQRIASRTAWIAR